MASNARIECKCCIFRHVTKTRISEVKPKSQIVESILQSALARNEPVETQAAAAQVSAPQATPSQVAPAPAAAAASPVGALAGLSLSMLLSSLGTSIANVALPTLGPVFGASFQQVQWIVLAYLLAITTLIVSVGKLGDLIGRRRLLLAGLALFTAASGLCGAAPDLWFLIAARVAQGLGAAIMMALTMALVGETVPKARTGSAMGLLGTMSAVGTALGPVLGGTLIGALGWRAIFLVNLPLGLVALGLIWRYLPAPAGRAKREPIRFDFMGTLLLALTLAAYALSMTLGRGHFGLANLALLLAALAGLAVFVFVEAKVAAPLVRLSMFRDAGLSTGFAINALVMTVPMATLMIGPFYLSGALGLDATRIGLAMSAGPIVSALTGVPAGRIVDRFGAAHVTMAGLLGIIAGATALAAITPGLGIAGYVASLVLTTASYALFQAANNTGVMKDVPQDRRGVVSGLLNLSRNLGLVTGAAALGAVFAAAADAVGDAATEPAAAAAGMHVTFSVAALLTGLALGIAGLGRRLQRR